MENIILNVWGDVFGRRVNPEDDFFELGGNSILAVSLVSKVEQVLGKELPLQAIFRLSNASNMIKAIKDEEASLQDKIYLKEMQTLPLPLEAYHKMLAVIASMDTLAASKAGSLFRRINTGGSKRPLFWCANSPGTMQILSESIDRDQPLYTMFCGAEVLENFRERASVEMLAASYIDEIISIQPTGPYLIGGNCAGVRVAVEMARQLISRNLLVEKLCFVEYFEPSMFELPVKMLLLFAEESDVEFPKQFNFGAPEWGKAFKIMPEVDWLPGSHGEMLIPTTLSILIDKISNFLDDVEPLQMLASKDMEAMMAERALELTHLRNKFEQKAVEINQQAVEINQLKIKVNKLFNSLLLHKNLSYVFSSNPNLRSVIGLLRRMIFYYWNSSQKNIVWLFQKVGGSKPSEMAKIK